MVVAPDGFAVLLEDSKFALNRLRISPEFCLWWPHHDAPSTLDVHKAIQHPTLGLLEFEQINLQVLSNPDIRIIIYAPLAETKAKMERLVLNSCVKR